MAHYALLDTTNIVESVIVGIDEATESPDGFDSWESYYATLYGRRCVRTSYNGNIRKQYAGIGYWYDGDADVFISPQPFPSWALDDNHDWQPPVPRPLQGEWFWDEGSLSWSVVEEQADDADL